MLGWLCMCCGCTLGCSHGHDGRARRGRRRRRPPRPRRSVHHCSPHYYTGNGPSHSSFIGSRAWHIPPPCRCTQGRRQTPAPPAAKQHAAPSSVHIGCSAGIQCLGVHEIGGVGRAQARAGGDLGGRVATQILCQEHRVKLFPPVFGDEGVTCAREGADGGRPVCLVRPASPARKRPAAAAAKPTAGGGCPP